MAINSVMSQPSPRFNDLNSEHLSAQIKNLLEKYRSKIELVKQNPITSWVNSIQPLEEAAEALDREWSVLEHLNAVANTPKIRQIYESLLPLVTNFHTDIMQDQDLFNIYAAVRDSVEFTKISLAQQMIINNELRDFQLSGVDLPEAKRAEYKTLVETLSALENDFANNTLDATEGWTYHVATISEHMLTGLPRIALDNAQVKARDKNIAGWILTLDQPCYQAVMTYARDRTLREIFYIAYNTRASDQGPNAGKWDNSSIMQKIVELRSKIANLIGFDTYAEFSLVPKMAESVKQVSKFLTEIAKKAKPQAQVDFVELQNFASQVDPLIQLSAWDVAYYSELRKQKLFDVDEEKLRVYFPAPKVLDGLFMLANKLFGLSILEVEDCEKWHASVKMYKVLDRSKQERGYFYIDLFTRPGKRGGAWMAECLSRIRFANGTLQLPIAYLNCNFAPPTSDGPALLTHDDVVTLFHEFGHTMHHVLTQIDYYSVSGMNGVSWDAVELPSQFMENWCWEWSVMQDISQHIDTGEQLPRAEFDKLVAGKNFQSALALVRQIEFALFDLRIHSFSREASVVDLQAELEAVRSEVGVIPVPANNRFQNTFGHIFAGGYAAGYYSYLWALVLSCDAFDKFAVNGLINFNVGVEFMENILEQGGSKPAMDLFVAFAGREPEVDALLRHHAITSTGL